MAPSLVAITMLARSGATALAWDRFAAMGFGEDDPAALAVKGRLLKDRARLAGDRRLFAEAAAAYARAGAIDGTTYPLINAATLTLLGGDAAGAGRLAAQVLALQDGGAPDAETPYYRGATRAEALLLLGRRDDAEAALRAAVALAPEAYEDHATTLRQFALILAETGGDVGWLEAFRPARTLFFAGRIAPPLEGEAQGGLVRAVADIVVDERIGSAWGALAAGADLVIAEVLVARGVALHVVLPAPVDVFVAASVAGYGEGWQARFEAVLAAAASIDEGTGERVDAATIAMAAERAMGRAILAAERLATAAVQLVVPAACDDGGSMTGQHAAIWKSGGRRQHCIDWPAPVQVTADGGDGTDGRLLALLELTLETGVPAGVLERVKAIVAPLAPLAAMATARGARFAWPDPAAAAAAGVAILVAIDPELSPRLAGHYAVVSDAADPFTGQVGLYGAEAARAARIAALTPAGAFYAGEDFLAGLVLRSDAFRHQFVGEAAGERAGGDLPLHSVCAGG